MFLKSILPFIAIGFFLLALLFRRREAGASGWIFIAGYCYFEASHYFAQDEYFDASLALVFLAFSLLLAFFMLKPMSVPAPGEKGEADLFFTITKVALITAVFYFPFSEIPFLYDSLIYSTAKITATMLNLFNPGSVYMDYPPSFIYSTSTSFDVEIILACTAIQSMVLFIGLIFGVNAPMRRKLKAFFVSVPVIYGLNIFRNVFVVTAYFEQWFASPRWQWFLQWFIRAPSSQSFDIAHNVIARIGVMISLIIIAYAVFVILPEALDLVEDFFRFIFKTTKRNN